MNKALTTDRVIISVKEMIPKIEFTDINQLSLENIEEKMYTDTVD